jgi:hypothetical protein
VDKKKARLVARGFSQREGIDYSDTFSPVIRHESIKIILTLAAREDLEVKSLDVKTAFLNGDVEEELYMDQPEGFEDGSRRVCKLVKSLYGLKQAPLQWNKRLTEFMKSIGLMQSKVDSCVFFSAKGDDRVIIGMYVDDGLICCRSPDTMNMILSLMDKEFGITHGDVNKFVGLEIHRDRERKSFFLTQQQYIQQTLDKYNMQECKGAKTPGDYSNKLTQGMSPGDEGKKREMASIPYREAIGSLMYSAVTVRPDIAFSVAQAAQFTSNPGPEHWTAVKRIMRYLKHTREEGLLLQPDPDSGSLIGYCDADHGGNPDNRKSTSGYLLQLFGSTVSWCSRLQRVVALSSCEAEYLAIGDAVKNCSWIRSLVTELGYEQQATEIKNDNQSAIKLVQNRESHKKTKHIDIRHHFVRDKQEAGEIEINYIPSEEQPADMLTKHLTEAKLTKCKQSTGIIRMNMMFVLFLLFLIVNPAQLMFLQAPPVIYSKSEKDVYDGLAKFVYKVALDPGCEKFAADNGTRLWCDQIYERHVIETVAAQCHDPPPTHRPKRFDPITWTVIIGFAIFGIISAVNGYLTITNKIAVTNLENRVAKFEADTVNIESEMNGEVGKLQKQILADRDKQLQMNGLLLDASEYAAVTVSLGQSLRVMFAEWHKHLITTTTLTLLNITLNDMDVADLKPLSCKWEASEKIMNMQFEGKVISKDQMILHAKPFDIFGRDTRNKDQPKLCVTKFVGPNYILWRKNDKTCPMEEVKNEDFYVRSMKTKAECNPPVEKWEHENCMPENSTTRKMVIQMHMIEHRLFLYCNMHNITIMDITSPCPHNPFLAPANTTFILSGYTFTTMPVAPDKPVTPEQLAIFQHAISTHLIKPPISPYDITDENSKIQAEIEHQDTLTTLSLLG